MAEDYEKVLERRGAKKRETEDRGSPQRLTSFPLEDLTYFVNVIRGADTFHIGKAAKHASGVLLWISNLIGTENVVIAQTTEYTQAVALREMDLLIAMESDGGEVLKARQINWMLVIRFIMEILASSGASGGGVSSTHSHASSQGSPLPSTQDIIPPQKDRKGYPK